MLYFFIGINVGAVLALGILADFKPNRFLFLCQWLVYRLEKGDVDAKIHSNDKQ